MNSIPTSIKNLTDAHAALVERLIAWSGINSGSNHIAGLIRMADALELALRELTPRVARIPLADGRFALRAELRPDAPINVLCSGHYDTVFELNHPFQSARLLESESRLNGPGVADMKGGIVVMLAALTAFEKSPDADKLGWTILLTPDEETGSPFSAATIAAEAPLHQLGLVFEPARETGNTVRSRAATAIFSVVVHGRSAHAGRNPAEGRNAVTALARLCLAVEQLPASIPDTLINIGNLNGGGTVNIVPDFARAEINARASTAAGVTAMTRAIQAQVATLHAEDGFQVELTGGFNRDPLSSTPATAALFPALQRCAAALGQPPPDWVHVSGGSDGNLLHAAGLPVLDGLGPTGGGLHSDREYIELPSLTATAQRAALFLHRLAAKEILL